MRSASAAAVITAATVMIAGPVSGAPKYKYQHADSLTNLSVQISGDDLINGILPLKNNDLAANFPANTNGYEPTRNMPDPCAPSPLSSYNTGEDGFHGATPQPNGAGLTDGIAGANVASVLADFLYPAGVFQFDLPSATDVGEIRVFAANTNRDGRVFQNYDVYISTDTNPDPKEREFTLLVERVMTSFVVCDPGDGFFPNANNGSQVPAIEATVTQVFDDAGSTLASNVTSVRFVFWAVSNTQTTFRDQWLGPISCGPLTIDQLDPQDGDGVPRAFESPVIKEIDIFAARSAVPEICDNSVDDDGDGQTDGEDIECFGLACDPEDCTNGTDDTGNGLIDCDDPDCIDFAGCGNVEICDNGIDDDGDSDVDCADSDCDAFEACQCSDPFADADVDGDVDQTDFAAFQRCVTGNAGSVAPGCECFDRSGPTPGVPDGRISQDDLPAFRNCASGPDVPADTGCDD